jgi:hypothetical protein
MGLAGLLATAVCSTTRWRTPETRGPFLSILPRDGATAARPAVTFAGSRPTVAANSMSLALGSLPPDELPRLREHLRDVADAIVRRAAPELFDLEESAAATKGDDPLRLALPDLPALTAAANMLGSPWEAPLVSVRLGPECEAEASRCVPVFAPPAPEEEALVRRGRALAWTLSNAALIRAPDSARPALIGALQEARRQPMGTIAMVFASAEGTLDEAELARLRGQARQSLEEIPPRAPLRPWLEALAAAPMTWKLPVDLRVGEVLVVPRLSALARLADFRAEVERAGSFKWIAGPGGARGK